MQLMPEETKETAFKEGMAAVADVGLAVLIMVVVVATVVLVIQAMNILANGNPEERRDFKIVERIKKKIMNAAFKEDGDKNEQRT